MSLFDTGGAPEAFESCLVVVAHPDDCDIGCSGTAAKWAADGGRVHLVVMTDGSKGSHDLAVSEAEVVARREEEQRRAAELLGFDGVTFCRYVDGELVHSEESIERLVGAIRAHRPDVVVSHDPWRLYQLHPDHRAVGSIVVDAVYRAGEPRFYRSENGHGHWKPRELWLFFAEQPNHVEDVTSWWELKWKALLCHESQFSSAFRFAPDEDPQQTRFARWFSERFAEIGERAGFRYGEEFRRIVLW